MKNKKYIWYAVWFLGIMLVCFLVSTFVIQLCLVQGNSMSPTLKANRFVLVNKWTDEYKTGDVIVFKAMGKNQLIKRIVACPGDELVIKDGTLFVNGQKSSVYPEEGIFSDAGIAREVIKLGSGEYFTIGDNYEKSKDSRYEKVGVVSSKQIIGRVIGAKKRKKD